MYLIGINGFKTSGKDTTFSIIKELAAERNEIAIRRAFADKLKIMSAKALGFDGKDSELIEVMNGFKETGRINVSHLVESGDSGQLIPSGQHVSGREYLQNFGEKARHVFGDTFWVDQVLPPNPITQNDWDAWGKPNWVCVTDVRYPNEAQRVLNLKGEIWEVVRPGLESDGHASEQPLSRGMVTRTIFNNGSLDDLRGNISECMKYAKGL